jgi:phospholipid/cholesterol/gamma-HCH transport system ATP-binding protein
MITTPFIWVRGLEKAFGGKPILRGIDLDIGRGETMVVLGGSGEGKSVMLRHLNGLLRPDRGEIVVNGERLAGLSEDAFGAIRLKVAMVFQGGALFDSLNVYQNIAYPLREHTTMSAARMRERVGELLAMVELSGIERLYPAQLSGGMRKRVALARAIALEPRAVLYDEPTTGLDPITTHKISMLIRSLQDRLGFTSVVVTHDIKSALLVGDRFALLDNGRVRFIGTAAEARASSDNLMRQFIGAGL